MTGSNATINQFTRRIVVLPSALCGWYGVAFQGCSGRYCYVWVRGDRCVQVVYGGQVWVSGQYNDVR